MPSAPLPPPTLDEAERDAWDRLLAGASRASHPFHTMSVATVGLDGTPQCRTVVLRKVSREARELWFHTDARSPKVRELQQSPVASLLLYDAAEKTQVRLDCRVRVHTQDEAAKARWEASKASSRLCYSNPIPSTVRVEAPPAAATVDTGGFERFAAVRCTARRLEWLLLRASGHVRAEFHYHEHGALRDSGFLAP
jgi:hypothetical protein